MNRLKGRLHPLDRLALSIMAVLSCLIVVLILLGDHTVPEVKDFNWQNRSIGSEDRAFTLTFNRPMNWDQVEANLIIQPSLAGKLSWSGRRMAYTLLKPVRYGQSFQLTLQDVQESQRGSYENPKVLRQFNASFRSRDRAFVYLGTNSEESGRLVLFNLTQQTKSILTPENLEILDFKPFPYGDRILFSATEVKANQPNVLDPNLYWVSTGLSGNAPDQSTAFQKKQGTFRKILSNDRYQLLKFDLSSDGQMIVLQRSERSQDGALGQVSMWKMSVEGKAEPIETESGGDFQISPDGGSIVMAQGQGLAVIPLQPRDAGKPLDFLPEFGNLLSFSQDGSAAAMVKFNNDYTRSLFVVTNQGSQTELIRIKGGILAAYFDPLQTKLYCLLTKVIDEKNYKEKPYLAVLDLKTKALTPILDLPIQPNITMALAPDARSILFDQILESSISDPLRVETDDNALIAASNLWEISLEEETIPRNPQPKRLSSGAVPRWLP